MTLPAWTNWWNCLLRCFAASNKTFLLPVAFTPHLPSKNECNRLISCIFNMWWTAWRKTQAKSKPTYWQRYSMQSQWLIIAIRRGAITILAALWEVASSSWQYIQKVNNANIPKGVSYDCENASKKGDPVPGAKPVDRTVEAPRNTFKPECTSCSFTEHELVCWSPIKGSFSFH